MRFKITMAALAAAILIAAPAAHADHADETATLSKAEGVADGETVTVTVSGMLKPGSTTAQVITANTWPVRGPEAFNLAEFPAAPTVTINADGTGSFEYVAVADHGTFNCLKIQCYIVVFQGIGFESFTAGAPISFAGAAPVATEPATTEPPATEPAVTEPAVTEPPATEPAPTQPPATEPAATAAPVVTEAAATDAPSVIATAPTATDETSSGDDSGGGGGSGLIIGIIAALVVLGGGAYAFTRKKAAK